MRKNQNFRKFLASSSKSTSLPPTPILNKFYNFFSVSSTKFKKKIKISQIFFSFSAYQHKITKKKSKFQKFFLIHILADFLVIVANQNLKTIFQTC